MPAVNGGIVANVCVFKVSGGGEYPLNEIPVSKAAVEDIVFVELEGVRHKRMPGQRFFDVLVVEVLLTGGVNPGMDAHARDKRCFAEQ